MSQMETSRQNNNSITIIDKPLNIGAEDLLKGVPYTHCGDVYLFCVWLLGKKWEHRYCIISQGCLYIYSDMTSKKTKHAYSLKDFESAQAAEPQEEKRFCIQLIFKNATTPLLFACDTDKRREEWLEHFGSTIAHVHTQTYLSADSGFGSAESVPKHFGRPEQVEEAYEYVDEEILQKPDIATKDSSKYSGKSNTLDSDTYYENAPTYSKESKRKQIHVNTNGKGIQVSGCQETDKGITKVKELEEPNHAGCQETDKDITKVKELEEPNHAESKRKQIHVNTNGKGIKVSGCQETDKDITKVKELEEPNHAAYEKTSIQATSGSSYLSVRGGAMSKVSEDTKKLSDREHEDLYVNRDSGDSSPDIIYENTEPRTFQKKDYFCTEKKQMKKELVRLPEGTFAVCVGDSSEMELSVKTETGLICFPIYSQDDMISLYRSHQYNTFPSLNDLLSYYVMNPLPSAKYSVRLVRGYKK